MKCFLLNFLFRNNINCTNKQKIVAKDRNHLKKLIKKEMKRHGQKCDLNHIDVSRVTDMNIRFIIR